MKRILIILLFLNLNYVHVFSIEPEVFAASLRSLYLQDRENKIQNNQRGRLEVIYKDEDEWEEIDNK